MALILFLLDPKQLSAPSPKTARDTVSLPLSESRVCRNRRCITTTEQELPQLFKLSNAREEVWRCIWCEHGDL
jgi:aspartate carbamoyltransferase regulatory subunit